MTTIIQINKRGTLTLPMTIRKKLGLEKGGAVIAEDTELGIVIKPAVTYPIEIYSDMRVKEIDDQDSALSAYLKTKAKKP